MSDVFREHRALVESGDIQAAIRLSGEALAQAEAALAQVRERPCGDDAKIAAAREFFAVAGLHLSDLNYVGMESDEAGLAVMVPATLLIMKVNPETMPVQYVYWLQMTVSRLAELLPRFCDAALENAFRPLVALAVATCDDYAARMELTPELLHNNDMLRESPDSDATFNGEKVVPTMAIDILMNFLAARGAQLKE